MPDTIPCKVTDIAAMDPWRDPLQGPGPWRPGSAHFDGGFFTEGILQGTRIATASGWRMVEDLSPGDLLLTFDTGLRPLQAVHRASMMADPARWSPAHWPVRVPVGAMGNRAVLDLLPEQPVLIECDQAEAMFGDPFALVPARSLTFWRGVEPFHPPSAAEVVILVFDAEQLVYAEGAALLWCPGETGGGVPAGTRVLTRLLAGSRPYVPLSLASARDLIACLMAEDIGAALGGAAPGGVQAALD